MRKRLLVAALLTCTALSARPAQAGPVIYFAGGLLNALGAGTFLGSSAFVGAWSAGFNVGTALGAFGSSLIGRAVLSVGFSVVSQQLAAGRLSGGQQTPSASLINSAQPLTPMEWVYGRVRKGGPLALSAESDVGGTGVEGLPDARRKRHWAVLLAAHPTEGPVQYWYDKLAVEYDANGFITTHPIRWEENGALHSRVRYYDGSAGQAADPLLVSCFPAITSAYDFTGLTYIATYGAHCDPNLLLDIYPNGGGRWEVTCLLDGHNGIYDPRDDSYGWTDNAALIIADNCLRYGKSVDWDQVAIEADICDELVTNASGGTQKRWTINCTFAATLTWEQVRDALTLACDGFFFEDSSGGVGFYVGGWRGEPDLVLTDDDFLTINIVEGTTGPDEYGEFCVQYVEPAYDYTEAITGAYVITEGGNRDTRECFLINSHNQGARVAKRIGRVQNAPFSISATLKMVGYELIGRRFARVTLSELPFDFYIEVGKLIRNEDRISFALEAVSVTEEDFAFAAALEEPARPSRSQITSDNTIAPLTALAGTALSGTNGVAVIEWSWAAQASNLLQDVRYRAPAAGLTDWQIASAPIGATSLLISGLIDGATYEAQVRNRNSGNRVSLWGPVDPVTVVAIANTVAPGAVTDFAAVPDGGSVDVTWAAPNDAEYFATRIYRAEDSTDFADAVLIHTEFGIPSAADSYADTPPSAADWSYWAIPINRSGVPGPTAGPETVTVI